MEFLWCHTKNGRRIGTSSLPRHFARAHAWSEHIYKSAQISSDSKYPYRMKEESKNAHQEGELEGGESTADTHDITDNSESLDCPSILQQPLNSGHSATPYNGQFSRSWLYANNITTPLLRFYLWFKLKLGEDAAVRWYFYHGHHGLRPKYFCLPYCFIHVHPAWCPMTSVS